MANPARWGSLNQRLTIRNVSSRRHYVCAACTRSRRYSLLSTTNPLRRNQFRKSTGIDILTKRSLHNDERKELENQEDLQSTIDNLRLTTEFEINNNIREYLRKWQEQNNNYFDPIRGPNTSNSNLLQSQRPLGNMMNDSQATYDNAVERSNSDIDEGSEFKIDIDDNFEVADILEPGDLVGFYSATALATPAIYIRSVERQKQYYTLRGKWRVALDRDADFVIKRFAPKELIDLILPYFPNTAATTNTNMQELTEGGIPRSVALPLITMLQEFDEQAKTVYRENSKRIDGLYDLVASADKRQVLTLHEIAAKTLNIDIKDVTPAALFMIHKTLQRIPFLIVSDRSSLFSTRYLVHPRSFAKDFNTVMGWVRDHQEHLTLLALQKPSDFKDHPLQKFLHKAQKLILQSRKIRSPTTMASVGPSAQRFSEMHKKPRVYEKEVTAEFSSEDERKILMYLLLFSVPPHRLNMNFARYAAIHIMRATGLYNAIELQRGAIPLLLQELGILTPWENIYALDQFLGLPNHQLDLLSDKMEKQARRAANSPENYKNDRMGHMRTDWGDLPIYCIDDPGAKEIDDGISLESVPGTEDTFWLRVHIANPTAFIPHDDAMIENAARRLSTVYLPERDYPMLPTFFTNKFYSLAGDRPTLTFSAKVDLDGDILETDITNGWARNVIHISHRKVRNILDQDVKHPQTFTIGGNLPAKLHQEKRYDLSEEQTQNFHTLSKIMAKINMKWRENGGLTWPNNNQKNPFVFIGNEIESPISIQAPGNFQGGYYLGDPVIGLTSNTADPYEIPDLSRVDIVALVMRLACHITGRWSADRNIPLIYDGTYFHPEYLPLTPERLEKITPEGWLQFVPPKGHSDSSVLTHRSLGVDAYTKVTSPLRRYTDLLAHYQIEAALRYEKEHGKKFDGNDAEVASLLPYSKQDVDQVLENMKVQFPLIKSVQNQSKTFWTCQFLFRSFYFGECNELPETYSCLVREKIQNPYILGSNYVGAYIGDNLLFGIRARLFVTEEFEELDLLGTVEAKIIAVNMAQHVVDMEVVRKVKCWERTGDWA